MDQERNILLKLGRPPAPAFQAVFPEGGINRQFHVSGVSLFVLGLDRLSRALCQKSTGAVLSTTYLSAFSPCLFSLWRLRRT